MDEAFDTIARTAKSVRDAASLVWIVASLAGVVYAAGRMAGEEDAMRRAVSEDTADKAPSEDHGD